MCDRHLDELPVLIIWVHNLAYEFQFLSGIYAFKNEECFFILIMFRFAFNSCHLATFMGIWIRNNQTSIKSNLCI